MGTRGMAELIRRRRGASLAAIAVSAAALWASMPPVGVGWLAWIALAPAAIVTLAAEGHMRRLAIPLLFAVYLELLLIPALPFGIAEGQWGDPALPVLIGDSPVIAVAVAAVPMFAAGLYAVGFGQPWGAKRLPPRIRLIATVLIPALAWAALEFVRLKLDPGAFWGPLFVSQADQPAGALGSLAGPLLITFAIVAVNYTIALAVLHRWKGAAAVAISAFAVIAGACSIGGDSTGSDASFAAAGSDITDEGRITVASVQPGYDTAEENRPELRFFRPGTYDLAALDMISDLGELTREAARQGAELVVWPEAALWVHPREDGQVRLALTVLSRATGASIVVPFFIRDRSQSAALVVTPANGLGPPRPKRRAMWFLGENAYDGEDVGEDPAWLGPMLGVDTQDTESARKLADGGATVLTSSTHDWRQLAAVHRSFARLSAGAAGLPLVRADWRYGSAVYDADGNVLADAGKHLTRTVVLADIEPGSGGTPYDSLGDAFGWITLLGAVGAWVLSRLPDRPRNRDQRRARSSPA